MTYHAHLRPVMIENCHQGGDGPGMVQNAGATGNCTGLTSVSDCPFNFCASSATVGQCQSSASAVLVQC